LSTFFISGLSSSAVYQHIRIISAILGVHT
jgi:hypothetical protein